MSYDLLVIVLRFQAKGRWELLVMMRTLPMVYCESVRSAKGRLWGVANRGQFEGNRKIGIYKSPPPFCADSRALG